MVERSKKLAPVMGRPAKTPDPLDAIVRANLKRFREAIEMNQRAAADLAGLPVENLRRYENGKTATVPGPVLRELGKIYGHAMDDFFERDPPVANLDERPVFFLRTRPGIEVDREMHGKLQDIIDKANRDLRTRRRK